MSITTSTCHNVVGIVVKPVATVGGHTWQNIEITMYDGAHHTLSLHLMNEDVPAINHVGLFSDKEQHNE